MVVRRLAGNPIIRPHMDERMGANINGPSLLRVPDWVESPLGKYYLYFAHHSGKYIRLAYADRLEGPWTVYTPGTLQLEQTGFDGHVASPDVHVDEENRRIVMYYHAAFNPGKPKQVTQVAFSMDGIHFETDRKILGKAYWRVFRWQGRLHAIAKPGKLFRATSPGAWDDFEEGPQIFPEVEGGPSLRHLALDLRGETLWVYYSRIGDCPERILRSPVRLATDWRAWVPGEPEEVLAPETPWEGGDLALEPSRGGQVHVPVRQLRDPAIYREGERTYLLYSVAGERGIAIAEIEGG